MKHIKIEDGWLTKAQGEQLIKQIDARKEILRRILNASGAEFDEGEVYVRCDENNAGRALKSLIWTVQQISDLISLSEESVDDEAEI